MLTPQQISTDRINSVKTALAEDIGSGDITALLVPASQQSTATVITREFTIIAGLDWVVETFRQVDPSIKVSLHCNDGDSVQANSPLFTVEGLARSLLTGERTALNFLQLLCGTATSCYHYAQLVSHTQVKLLDTRKTIPGLRTAQKYAVTQGNCYNHRIGLYDAFLIKENHINACGSIANAIAQARIIAPEKPVEVEVESEQELLQALKEKADIIMLDNFSIDQLKAAVALNKSQFNGVAKLESSGNVTQHNLALIAETGVDYISIGALTKDCKAIDLSMRFT